MDPKTRQMLVEESFRCVVIAAQKTGCLPRPSDLSLEAARRFAEAIILMGEVSEVEEQMLLDRAGALAFLAVASQEHFETVAEMPATDFADEPATFAFYPACAWVLAAIARRMGG